MGCPKEVEIGDNLVFSVTTHTFATGALTDADAAPTYRIYEDETAAAILTGSMAKLDDDNTTGFYSESIACTLANGFENGKTYTIYISAAVASITGAISYGFKAYDYRKANLTHILGTLLTETAGQIAAAFKKFFNIATPTGTVNSLPDAVPGANGGLPTTNGAKINQTVDLTSGQSIACSDKTGFSLSVSPPTAADIKTALEADGSKLDHLWEMTEDDGGVRRFTENALEEAPSSSGLDAAGVRTAIGLSSANLDTQLSTIDANVDAILVDTGTTIPALINAGAGAGTILHTYTVTDSGDGSPIDGVEVWVSTDAAGVNVVASGYTNSSGVFSVMLDAGTYYFWRKRSGYNFTNPDTETVA